MADDGRISLIGTLEGNLTAELTKVAASGDKIEKSTGAANKELSKLSDNLKSAGDSAKTLQQTDLSGMGKGLSDSATASDSFDASQTRLIAKSSRLIQRLVSLQFALSQVSSAAPGGFGKLQTEVDAGGAALGAFGSVASLFPNQFGLIAGSVVAAGAAINVFSQKAEKAEADMKALLDRFALDQVNLANKRGSVLFEQIIGGDAELVKTKQALEDVKTSAVDAFGKVELAKKQKAAAIAIGDQVGAVKADFDLDKAAKDALAFYQSYKKLADEVEQRETIDKVTKDLTDLYEQFDDVDKKLNLHVITPLEALQEKAQLAAQKLKLAFDLAKAVPDDSTGFETIVAAADELVDSQKEYNRQLENERDIEEEIATFKKEQDEAIKDRTDAAQKERETQAKETEAFYQGIAQGIGQAFAQATSELIDGLVQGKINFQEFAGQFLLQISKMILQAIVLKGVMAGLGVLGLNGGGSVPGFENNHYAEGGSIPGPSVDADVIPAMLTPGEYVVRKSAAQMYGPRVMSAINRGLVPPSVFSGLSGAGTHNASGHFAAGGEVPFGAGAAPGPAMAFVMASDSEVERLLAGGEGAQMRFFERNKHKMRAILGVGGG